MNLVDLVCTALTMLIGEEGTDFIFYEADTEWWAVRLYPRRN